jgi:hypothetical protein
MSACGHCDGTGYCTRPGCPLCAYWQAVCESPECGTCQGTAVCWPPASAPAEVGVRVLGGMPGVATVLRLLHNAAQAGGVEVTGQTHPHPNRREPGYRVYLTLRFPSGSTTDSCGAVHSRQAIHRPAAPLQEAPTRKRHHP